MVHWKSLTGKKQPRGQSLVELAFTLPIFLILVLGIIEVARLVFVYNAVYTASREAARYGASIGLNASGVPHYNDCAGMRARAKQTGILAGLTDGNIIITYDSGPDSAGNVVVKGTCPIDPTQLMLGDRVVVKVTAYYSPIVPLPGFSNFPIVSTTGRTVIKDMEFNWTAP